MHRVLVLTAVATLLALTASTASAQPQTLRLRELDRGSRFTYVDNPPRSRRRPFVVSPGDVFVLSVPLVDEGGRRVGRLLANCIAIIGGRENRALFQCSGTYRLPDGDIWVHAFTGADGGPVSGPVVGGTDSYDGATGRFVSRPTRRGSDTTITLR